MNRIALDLGFIQIYWYSIFIFLGVLIASMVIYKEVKKRNIDEDFFMNLLFYTIILGIFGARLYYVLFNLPYYSKHLFEIFQIWNGGLAIHGGILVGLLFIISYTKKYQQNTLEILDIIVVGLIIGQAIGRWGNFFNSEAYGAVTTLSNLKQIGVPAFIIKGMYIMGDYRQPTFFYESLWDFIGFIALIIIRHYRYLKVGQLTGIYLMWYGVIRFIIEGMRTDSLMLGSLRIAQVVSIIMFVCGLVIFFIQKNKGNKFDNLYNKIEVNTNNE